MKMTSHVTLCRFQGSNSISSDMYFNRETGAGGGMRQSQSYGSNFQVITSPIFEFEIRNEDTSNQMTFFRPPTWTT